MLHFWGIGKLLQTELFELYTIFHVEQVHLDATKFGLQTRHFVLTLSELKSLKLIGTYL